MLSNNPAVSSPPLELRPPAPSVPAHALQPQVAIPDNGYVSPRQQLERRTVTPASPPQPQHGLNAPRPSLSPLSEYHSGFADEDLGSPCPSPSPSPSPFSLANHRRQHSFSNLLPLAFRSRTPSPTRKTHTRSPSEQMPYTGDGRSNGRTAADGSRGGGGLVSWLSGSAGAASALGLSPTGAGANGSSKDAPALDTTPTRLRGNPAGPGSTASEITTPKSTMTTASRFMSALSSRFTQPTTPANPSHTDDELCNLNIEAALFPRSSPSSPRGDPFSPSSYKNLQMNALGLLTKMQTAYREQSATLRELQAERSEQGDQLDEAVMRATHLKMQLEGMAKRAQEQEKAMNALAEELAAEKRARARAEEAAAAAASIADGAVRTPSEGASMVSEDLGVDEDRRRQRRRRRSRKSWKSGVSGQEEDTDEDENESAESESVFSRCRSPALPPQAHTVSSDGASSAMGGMMDGKNTGGGGGSANVTPKQRPGQPMSAFQKILKGISGESGSDAGCGNCKGQSASVAWDTVGLLRDENRDLKRRVGELEVAVEGALDLVNGIGL